MGTLKDILESIEPCDTRNFIQILNEQITKAIIEAKQKACDRVAEVLGNYGIEDFQPCEFITEEFLEQVTGGESILALENILENQGYPPHLIKFISKGPDKLITKEYQDVLVWTSPLTGIQVHNNTAQYIKDLRQPNNPEALSESKRQEVQSYYTEQGITNITQYFQSKVTEYISSKLKCPPVEVVEKLLTIAQNLTTFLNKAQQALAKIAEVARIVSGIVNVFNNTVPLLKKAILALDLVGIPTLAAVPVIGGLAAILANLNRILSNFLNKFSDQIKNLAEALCATTAVITFASAGMTLAYAFIQMIEELLRGCIAKEDQEDIQLLSRLTPNAFNLRQSIPYRGYEIEVRTDTEDTAVPRRYAVALDPSGVVVLQGPKSYSSSTKVLIEELKFRIDNQLG